MEKLSKVSNYYLEIFIKENIDEIIASYLRFVEAELKINSVDEVLENLDKYIFLKNIKNKNISIGVIDVE